MIRCTDRLHFAYLFIRGWTFKLFLPLPLVNGAAVNIHGQVFKADSLKFFYDSLLLNFRINLGLNLLTVCPGFCVADGFASLSLPLLHLSSAGLISFKMN